MTQNPGQIAGPPHPGSQPNSSSGLDRFFSWLRGIDVRRDTEDKWLAGVCSGIANRLGVDPLVIRAALVVLILLGGIGVTLYLIAWAFIPNDREEIVAERGLRHGDFWGIAILVLIALSLVGGTGVFDGNGWGLWWLWWLVIAVGVVIWLANRSRHDEATRQQVAAWGQQAGQWGQQAGAQAAAWGQDVGQKASAWGGGDAAAQPPVGQPASGPMPYAPNVPGTGTGTPVPPGAAGPVAPGSTSARPGGPVGPGAPMGPGGPGGPGMYAPPPVPAARPPQPPRPRHRSAGFLAAVLVSGLALCAYGLTVWAHGTFNWSGDERVLGLASALAVFGIAVLAMGLAGFRAGFTGFIAVVLAITTWFASLVPGLQIGGGVGDREWRPLGTTSSESFSLGAGSANLRLGDYPTNPATPGKVSASIGAGELRIYVPDDLTVEIRSNVNVGEIKEADGWDLQNGQWTSDGNSGRNLSSTEVIGSGPTDLVVTAKVGLGQIIIGKE
ncbi:phage shock protein C (PspC) family protein [Pedococcus cremeus]|uniref:Phage shock protein C (PspC) family protein n=1 Tax=Pedococcus cremeus TaxID=587636 RepID=A0A1H9XM40_9MICO|nr:PspC domain-containing protein [Pedococcus cremeus]SES47246.1 phage shock protein C (PspC) family protein [Pedococcus cremeus]